MKTYTASAYVHIRFWDIEAESAEEAGYKALEEGNYEIYDVEIDWVDQRVNKKEKI